MVRLALEQITDLGQAPSCQNTDFTRSKDMIEDEIIEITIAIATLIEYSD